METDDAEGDGAAASNPNCSGTICVETTTSTIRIPHVESNRNTQIQTTQLEEGRIPRFTDPPSQETVVHTAASFNLDLSKLIKIDLSATLPLSGLTQGLTLHGPYNSIATPPPHIEASATSSNSLSFMSNPCSYSRELVPMSSHRSHLRLARRLAQHRIGLSEISGERKLFSAVRNGDLNSVNRLLSDGVSANVSDSKRRTPLHLAASQGLDDIANTLLANRANPNKVDILGNSPLHLAVCHGDAQIVRVLIGSGADIHIKDNIGRTPLDIVKSRLNNLRRDRSISTDKLVDECRQINEMLKIHASRHPNSSLPSMDALCGLMAGVSTREQADEIADAMISSMLDLSIVEERGKEDEDAELFSTLVELWN